MKKLVRDKIPQIIRSEGKEPVFHVAQPGEYTDFLHKKLGEECREFLEARTPADQAAELADVLEVVDALIRDCGLAKRQVLAVKSRKKRDRGGFSKKYILDMGAQND